MASLNTDFVMQWCEKRTCDEHSSIDVFAQENTGIEQPVRIERVQMPSRSDRHKKRRRVSEYPSSAIASGTVTDNRFASVHSDPVRYNNEQYLDDMVYAFTSVSCAHLAQFVGFSQKFARLSRERTEVAVDDRFSSMLTDGRFEDGKVLGFKLKGDSKTANDQPSSGAPSYQSAQAKEEDDTELSWQDEVRHVLDGTGQISLDRRLEVLGYLATGEVELESSDEEDNDESGGDGAAALMREDGLTAAARAIKEQTPRVGDEDEEIEEGDETRRLAFVNLDWSRVKARDVLAVARSFAPTGGAVRIATIYVSDFGKKQLEVERERGPTLLAASTSSYAATEEGAENDLDLSAVRQYELSKLRYFFAIVECDSASTGLVVQQECDGRELEYSGNVMDVRFVPDDQSFDGRPVHDSATRVEVAGARYRAPQFSTKALYATQVDITWDAEDEDRQRLLSMRYSGGMAVDDGDLEQYLGSGSDSEEESESAKNTASRRKGKKLRSKMKAALLGKSTGGKLDVGSHEKPTMEESGGFLFDPLRHQAGEESDSDDSLGSVESEGKIAKAGTQQQSVHRKETSGYKKYMKRRKELRKARKDAQEAASYPAGAASDERFNTLLAASDFAVDPTDPRARKRAST